jgi:lipopolysaccharide transport system permease protein
MSSNTTVSSVTIIKPTSGWRIADFQAFKEYRDLFWFLVLRDVKVMYAQTILGFAWALLQPLMSIVIFSIVFGKVAKVSSDGVPYILFSSVAIIPWSYMSQAMTESSQSLIQGQNMLGKVYFPRLIFPLTPVLSKLISFAISLIIIVALAAYYRVAPTWNLLLLPLLILQMMSVAAGTGMWLSALAIRFRDVKHAMPFVIQMLMYSAPIVYSARTIPDAYRLIYAMNPIVGVIEGYRACLLGSPIPWQYIFPGLAVTVILLIAGAVYFNRMERIFADVI